MSINFDEVDTLINMSILQNHINTILKIKELAPDIEQLYMAALLKQAINDYLDTYGVIELDLEGNPK